jgi:hypothetical protein
LEIMQSSLTPGYGPWLEPIVVLAVGTAVIVGVAAIVARLARSAAWQRTIWQATTLGLLVLLVVELTGTGSAFVRLVGADVKPIAGRTGPASVTLDERPPDGLPARSESAVVPRPVSFPNSDGPAPDRGRYAGGLGGFAESMLEERTRGSLSPRKNGQAEGVFQPTRPRLRLLPKGHAPSDGARPTQKVHRRASAATGRADEVAPVANGQTQESAHFVSTRRETDFDKPRAPPVAAARRGEGSWAGAAGDRPSRTAWWPAVIWGLGTIAVAGRFAWAQRLLVAFRRRHAAARDEALCRRVATLARRQGIRGPVTVLEAVGLATPVAFGSFRPTLAIPVTFAREFDPAEQEAMIVHELAHLAARDPAWQLLADLLCAALWWHPFSWWSRRKLREASEAAADEASLLVPGGPELLASSLLVLGKRLAGTRPRLGWLSAGGPHGGPRFRSGLGRRVERLLSLARRSRRRGPCPGRACLALAKTALPVALVIVAVLCTAWARPQVPFPEGETTMAVVKMSWHRSLAAAAVAAFMLPISGDVMSQEEGDRPVAERRDPERPERGERPGDEREFLRHQIEVLRLAMHALREAERGDAVELVERAIHAREVTLEGRRDDEAHMIREHAPPPHELAEILGMAVDLWREFDNPEKAEEVARLAQALRAPRDRGPERERDRDRERVERERRRVHAVVGIAQLKRNCRELEGQARGLEMKLHEELRVRGPEHPEVKQIEVALRETREKMAQVQRELAEAVRDWEEREMARRDPDRHERERELPEHARDEVARRYFELREAAEDARRAGRHEEAERIAREIEETKREWRGRAARRVPHPEEREELERRMSHVRVAVENLHAAGLHEHAERLAHEAERLLAGRPEAPRPQPRDPFAPPRAQAAVDPFAPPRPEAPRHAEQREGVLHELHEAVRQLDRRMDELAGKVEHEIQQARERVEVMGREVDERTAHLQERNEDLQREIQELETLLDEVMDLEEEEEEEEDFEMEDEDDEDEEEEEEEDEDD